MVASLSDLPLSILLLDHDPSCLGPPGLVMAAPLSSLIILRPVLLEGQPAERRSLVWNANNEAHTQHPRSLPLTY